LLTKELQALQHNKKLFQKERVICMKLNKDFLEKQERKAAKAQEKANEMNDPVLEQECKTIQDFLLSNIRPKKCPSEKKRKRLREEAHKLGYKLTTRFEEWWEKRTGQEWNSS